MGSLGSHLRPLAAGEGLEVTVGEVTGALMITVFLAGLRHGFDVDHIAAITDIVSASRDRRTSFFLATTYAIGHMVVVFALGVAAVVAGSRIPASWDAVAGRVIGVSLIALGAYVIYSLARHRSAFRMKSRWMLLIAGARRGLLWLRPTRHVVVEHEHEHASGGHHHHAPGQPSTGEQSGSADHLAVATRTTTHSHLHTHVVPMPPDPFTEYGPRTSFLVGMIHGVGAETPTQILLFTTAAGLSGAWGGVSLVALFVVGLLLGNTVLATVSVAGVWAGGKFPLIYMGMAAIAAVFSILVGSVYLFEGLHLSL